MKWLLPGCHQATSWIHEGQTSSSRGTGGCSTLGREVGTQGVRRWPPPTTLAVLLVGLFFTLSLRLRKRLRARQDAGTVQAVNVDRDARTSCCCCLCSSNACCRCSGCRWATVSCRASSCCRLRGLAGYIRRASGVRACRGGRALMFPVEEREGGRRGSRSCRLARCLRSTAY